MEYTNLGSDVLLEYKGDGVYDRKVVSGDFVKVSGVNALYTGICFKIMTIFGELKDNPSYNQFGNKSWFLMKDLLNVVNLNAIRDYTREALEGMRRIKSVDVLTVEEDTVCPYMVRVAFSVTAITDEDISGGVTLVY